MGKPVEITRIDECEHVFMTFGKMQERCRKCGAEHEDVTRYRQNLMAAIEIGLPHDASSYPRHPFLTMQNNKGDSVWKHKDLKRYMSMRRR